MAADWRETTLGGLLSFSNGRSSPLRSEGLPNPVFGSNGIIGFADEANAAPSTIVVGRVGSYCGSLHFSSASCWVTDNAIQATAIDENDARFLFYLLSTLRLNDRRAGSGQPLLNQSILSSIPVVIPAPNEQRAIAHILGTLDDKIELNRRMNGTLEAMSRALFKSWFVDFDPVRAKAALRNHSPLEGESARQGRSPQPSRWGEIDGETNKWGAIKRFYTQQTLQKAQTLRESQTNAEGLLWHYLRDKQLAGYKFRRQQPIGPYIVDFACMPKKLLIELDGGQHAEQHTYDKKRDEFLRGKRYKILRFWNNDVFENCFGVLESIRAAVQDPPPQQSAPNGLTTATPPQGGSDWSVERARAYLDRMPQRLADLFPDRLVDSELGPIPEGWEVKALDKIANFQNGLALQKFRPTENEKRLPVVKISQLRSGQVDSGEWATENITPECIVDDGDVLFSWSGSLMVKIWCGGRAALNQHLFKVTSLEYPKWFYLHCLEFHLHEFQSIAVDKTTTMGHIKRQHLSEAKCAVPDLTRFSVANDTFSDLLAKRISNVLETNALATLRDALLPKLLSGSLLLRD